MKAPLRLIAITILLVSTLIFSTSALAQDKTGGSGIQISPTRTELSVLPGEQKTFKITIKNISPIVMLANVYVNDFTSDNETGSPKIETDTNKSSPRSIKPFLGQLSDYELAPNESKDINISASVPANASPGAYYGIVRYAAIPKGRDLSQNERQVALTASVGSLVLLQVPGETTEGMTYDELQVLVNGKSGTFFINSPTQTMSRLTNTGNTFVQPFGKVVVSKNGKEVYSFEFNATNADGQNSVANRGTILPQSSRNFTDNLKNITGLGKYDIVSSLSFKQGGEVITAKKTFYVVPLWFIIAVVTLIALIIFAIFYSRRRSGSGSRRLFKKKK